jgi:hypothetical protein
MLCRDCSAGVQLFVVFGLAAGADGAELDTLDSLPDAAFVSVFESGLVSLFVSGFFSEATPSPLADPPFGA